MTDLEPCFPSDSDSLAAFHHELAKTGEVPRLLGADPTLWPRFPAYYRSLARLWRVLVCFLVALFLASQAQAIDSDDLAISVTASRDPVVPGGLLIYQLTATNRGTIPTTGGVTMSAFIPGSTRFAGVTDGGVCPGGVCQTGEAVTWSLSDLPAGSSRTVGLSVQVFSVTGFPAAPPDGSLIAQQAAVTSEEFSAFADRTIIVHRTPVLSLSMRAERDPIEPGSPLTYTLVFSNSGQSPAQGVTLRALVPGGTTFQSADGGGIPSGGAVTWSLGTVGAGQSGKRHFAVIVDP
ncbi:MAG: hypothetical protein ACREA0_02105 [bacterium]